MRTITGCGTTWTKTDQDSVMLVCLKLSILLSSPHSTFPSGIRWWWCYKSWGPRQIKDSDSSWVEKIPWWNSSLSFYFRIQIHVEMKLMYSFESGSGPKGLRKFGFRFESALAPYKSWCGVNQHHQRVSNRGLFIFRNQQIHSSPQSGRIRETKKCTIALSSLAPNCELSQSKL